ncbi:hypothetical protein EB796_012630 [Bugula neritina]|uniref:Uncharacterized protein n=1 Tax=Bugula neritina TaxID=10212 RepID=A0A7J7JRW3_BUGNE|nr:hypothetical protein EB796_012630 [Bugula neritina]
MASEESVHRLDGSSGIEKGGLVIMKKTKNQQDEAMAPPKASLFGLDKLASQKRKEADANEVESKKSRSGGKSDKSSRYYRERGDDTPSHPGGVSTPVRDTLRKHRDKKDRGVYAGSRKKEPREREKDYREHRRYNRENERSDRSRRSERERRAREWEETPSRSSTTGDIATPNIYRKETPSQQRWDEDDPTPLKKSSWDLPTPRSHSGRDGRSERYSSSRHSERSADRRHRNKDETPLPTPSYKYNSWMKDKKKLSAYTPLPGATDTDEGYDDTHNPFADTSDEYAMKKEKELEVSEKL